MLYTFLTASLLLYIVCFLAVTAVVVTTTVLVYKKFKKDTVTLQSMSAHDM